MGADTRRLLLVLLAGMLLSASGAVWLQRGDGRVRAADDDPLAFARRAGTTTTEVATETTLSAARPVVPPRDAYAAEPIQEIGTIEIPKIGLRHRVFHGITLRNIDKGPSHWPGTAFPGENGNSVFAGHRVTHTHPFRRIDELVPGDEVHFDIAGVKTTYVVTGSRIVTPKQLEITLPTAAPTATLFACHPPGSARQRYVVTLALLK
ncbi:MAG TPA: class E sortase [Acidimicrobiales bacterium]|nr:class E sortase [Acidimicrobiales bacterium]